MALHRFSTKLISYEKGKKSQEENHADWRSRLHRSQPRSAFAPLGGDVSIIDSLRVNNLASFSATSEDSVNRSLYLRILNERQRLLQNAQIPLFVQDARNYHALSQLISQIGPQVVIQLAAVSHANKSNKDPYSTFDHSFRTLENALDASRDRVEHFIYFSSSMVYGHFTETAVTEESNCNPLGIYGA